MFSNTADDTPLPTPDSLRTWLFGTLLPTWHAGTFSPRGGYSESLDARGEVIASSERTPLCQARMLYVYAHAYVMTGDTRWLEAAQHALAWLQEAGVAHRSGLGWQRRRTLEGEVLDPAYDSYDHAFVLFGLAWYFRATGSGEARELAEQCFSFLSTELADAEHGGYHEERRFPAALPLLPRRQNPHMHLFEAALAWADAGGEPLWLARADAMFALFERHFFDARSGSLIEYFGRDWSPAAGEPGRWREPGHQFEWVWLLAEYHRHRPDSRLHAYMDKLFRFGKRFGMEDSPACPRLVFDAVSGDGRLLADTKLLWPQTEYIKACVALACRDGEVRAHEEALRHAARMRQAFFLPNGAYWHNQLDRAGAALPVPALTRVLYHVMLALAEVLRTNA